MEFSSINPYQSLEVLIAESPQELVKMLKQIQTPIRIEFILASGNRREAYISGDVRINNVKKKGK